MFRMLIIGALMFAPGVASAQQPCTTDAQQIVDRLYMQMLNRSADANSAAWVRQLSTGTATVSDLVRNIATSPEYSQRFISPGGGNSTLPGRRSPVAAGRGTSAAYDRAVGALYQQLLDRQPDTVDRLAYAKVAAAAGFAAVVDDIIASPEYQRATGDWGVPGRGGLRYCANGSQSAQQNSTNGIRFRGMDRNNDGIISRSEWRGSLQSFRVHDWNHDGVLSGDEVRAGGVQNGRNIADENFDRNDRFDDLDLDRDGRIEWREWHGTVEAFESIDRNNDNVLSRAELAGSTGVAATSGQTVVVHATERWTDTGIDLRPGDTVVFDATGTVQMSPDPGDVASPDGSRTGRLAPDAPVRERSAGALVARIGNSAPIFLGAHGSITRSPASGRLYLTVNDDYLGDNAGEFRVMVSISNR